MTVFDMGKNSKPAAGSTPCIMIGEIRIVPLDSDPSGKFKRFAQAADDARRAIMRSVLPIQAVTAQVKDLTSALNARGME